MKIALFLMVLALSSNSSWSNNLGPAPIVLMYHDIPAQQKDHADKLQLYLKSLNGHKKVTQLEGPHGDVVKSDFYEQLTYLSNHGAHFVSTDDLYRYLLGKESLPDNSVVITFDDGYRSNFYALMTLKYDFGNNDDNGTPATFFVHTQYLGVTPTAEEYKNDPYAKRHLELTDLLALINDQWQGHNEMPNGNKTNLFRVASHTLTHQKLSSLNDADLRKELVTPRRFLSTKLSSTDEHNQIIPYSANYIAYPYGNITPENKPFSPRVLEAVKKACYTMGFVIGYPSNLPENLKYSMLTVPRIEMSRDVYVHSDDSRATAKNGKGKKFATLIADYKAKYSKYLETTHREIKQPDGCSFDRLQSQETLLKN